ncbi:MAG: four helix bundle protein [Bacteroidia bacterium]|nr:four helix bundle protein [Bacteroidia bacterium]
MSVIRDFKDLLVWQKAMQLSIKVFVITKKLPKEEMYGMSSQLRRAAVSVAANIAEGHGRNTKGEYRQFLGIAKGSLAELETLLLLSKEMDYLNSNTLTETLDLVVDCNRMLKKLIQALK